jgi:hypothetical protein
MTFAHLDAGAWRSRHLLFGPSDARCPGGQAAPLDS